MRWMIVLAAVVAALWVSGCAGPGEFPVSRAKAGAGDPVLRIPVPPLPEALRRG